MLHGCFQRSLLFPNGITQLLQPLVIALHTFLCHFGLYGFQLLLQCMDEGFGIGIILAAAGIGTALLPAAVILVRSLGELLFGGRLLQLLLPLCGRKTKILGVSAFVLMKLLPFDGKDLVGDTV